MRAEDLLTQTGTAHGIDFKSVAGNSSNTKGAAKKRRRSREEVRENPGGGEDAKGTAYRTSRALTRFIESLGLGAQGISSEGYGWSAVVWTLNISRSPRVRAILHTGLLGECVKLAARYRWKDTVRKRNGENDDYLEALCRLVLAEECDKAKFAENIPIEVKLQRYLDALHVTQETWDKDLGFKYQALQVAYQTWFSGAMGVIQRRINGEPLEAEYLEECAWAQNPEYA